LRQVWNGKGDERSAIGLYFSRGRIPGGRRRPVASTIFGRALYYTGMKKKNNIVRHEEILMGFDWLPGIRALPS
jgi:hypothetical protein